jgi:large subunit ribosomal protein L33
MPDKSKSKGKKGREKFKLVSTAVLENGKPSGYYYTVQLRKGADKLERMKYDPRVRRHVLFKQAKLSK